MQKNSVSDHTWPAPGFCWDGRLYYLLSTAVLCESKRNHMNGPVSLWCHLGTWRTIQCGANIQALFYDVRPLPHNSNSIGQMNRFNGKSSTFINLNAFATSKNVKMFTRSDLERWNTSNRRAVAVGGFEGFRKQKHVSPFKIASSHIREEYFADDEGLFL